MRRLLLFLFLLLLVFLESFTTSIPLVLPIVLAIFVLDWRPIWLIIFVFLAGIFLDGLSFGVIGQRSLFFVLFLLVVMLYERKFEVKTVQFVVFTSFVGSFLYLLLFKNVNTLLHAAVASLIALLFFVLLLRFQKAKLARDV